MFYPIAQHRKRLEIKNLKWVELSLALSGYDVICMFVNPTLHIWTWETLNSDTELKLSTDIRNVNTELKVKNCLAKNKSRHNSLSLIWVELSLALSGSLQSRPVRLVWFFIAG